MIVTIERAALIIPLGDQGDRAIQGISTIINEPIDGKHEWYAEADMHMGRLGDITLYRNTSVHIPNSTPTWRYHCAIPTANIKSYRVRNQAAPTTYASEPQAPNPTTAKQARAEV